MTNAFDTIPAVTTTDEFRRPDWREYFLSIAEVVATRADCTRRQVGCVVVDQHHRIISAGYNGAPSGQPGCATDNACPRGRMSYGEVAELGDYDRPGTKGFCIAVHAEVNAALHAGQSLRGTTFYITDQPCPGCRKVMAAAGVSAAVWRDGQLVGDELTEF